MHKCEKALMPVDASACNRAKLVLVRVKTKSASRGQYKTVSSIPAGTVRANRTKNRPATQISSSSLVLAVLSTRLLWDCGEYSISLWSFAYTWVKTPTSMCHFFNFTFSFSSFTLPPTVPGPFKNAVIGNCFFSLSFSFFLLLCIAVVLQIVTLWCSVWMIFVLFV